MNKAVINLFKSEGAFLKSFDNGDDCVIYPNISDYTKLNTRASFRINQDEEYLIYRDTSAWNTADEGAIVSDLGVTVKTSSNTDDFIYFEWSNIEKVSYQDLSLLFHDNTDQPYSIPVYYFVKAYDEELIKVGKKLARLFSSIAKIVEPEKSDFEKFVGQLNNLDADNKTQEAIELCEKHLYDFDEERWLILYWLSNYYCDIHDYEEEYRHAKEGLKYCEIGSSAYVKLAYMVYDASISLGNIKEARKFCFEDVNYATDEQNLAGVSIRKDASKDFQKYESLFCSQFLDYPYSERKILVPVKEYTDLSPSSLSVINISNLPQEITFPVGHPIANHVYVGHPYLAGKYMPIEEYQLELVEDKVREFCQIAQYLGATEISIECLNSNSNEQSDNSGNSISGSVDALRNGSAQYKSEFSRHMIDSLSNAINLHQTFFPTQAPSLPDNLVWYQNEPSWQRLYEQRIRGGLLSHEERIETIKSQVVDSREMQDIKGEIEGLFIKMNLRFEKSDEQRLRQQENATLAIKITFAPLEQLTCSLHNLSDVNNSAKYSSIEQEYLHELKECLADGEIGTGERRLLGKLAAKLGISSERAAELEASLAAPVLSDDEKEYLEEYKAAAVDGAVSEKERRLLDKLKKMYGISDERARTIEVMV